MWDRRPRLEPQYDGGRWLESVLLRWHIDSRPFLRMHHSRVGSGRRLDRQLLVLASLWRRYRGKYVASFPALVVLSANLIHGSLGALKLLGANAMGGRFGQDAVANQAAQIFVAGTAAQQLASVPVLR